VQWVECLIRKRSVVRTQSKAPVVSLGIIFYPHCLVLVDFRDGLEHNIDHTALPKSSIHITRSTYNITPTNCHKSKFEVKTPE